MAYLQIGGKNIPLSEDFTPQLEIQGYTPNEPTFTRLPFTANFDILRNAEIDEVFDNAFDGFQLRSARVKPYAPIPCGLILGGNDALNGTGQLVLESVTPQKYVVRIRTNGTDFTTAAKARTLRAPFAAAGIFPYTAAGMAALVSSTGIVRANRYDWGGNVEFGVYLPQFYLTKVLAPNIAAIGYTLNTTSCMSAAGQSRIAKWMGTPPVGVQWRHCEETINATAENFTESQTETATLVPPSFSNIDFWRFRINPTLAGVYSAQIEFNTVITVAGLTGGNTATFYWELFQVGVGVRDTTTPIAITFNGSQNFTFTVSTPNAWKVVGEFFQLRLRATTTQSGIFPPTLTAQVNGRSQCAIDPIIYPPATGNRYCTVSVADMLPNWTVQDALNILSGAQDLRVIIDDTTKTVYLSDLEYTRKAAPLNIGTLVGEDTANAANWYDSIDLHSDDNAETLTIDFTNNDDFLLETLGRVTIGTNDTTGEKEKKYIELAAAAAGFTTGLSGLKQAQTLRRWFNVAENAYEVRACNSRLVAEFTLLGTPISGVFNDGVNTPVTVSFTRICTPASDAIAAAYAVGFSTLLTNYALYEVSMLADMDTMRNIQSNNGGVPNLARPVLIPPFPFLFLLAQTTNYDNDYTPYTAKLYPIE